MCLQPNNHNIIQLKKKHTQERLTLIFIDSNINQHLSKKEVVFFKNLLL